MPLGPGVNISNIGFHAPPQHPGWANDGTFNSQGYSSTPWTPTQTANSLTWNCEAFAQNQNANAIRWGTLFNFRFDADQPPQAANATVDFFKTGAPITIQAPVRGDTNSDTHAYPNLYAYGHPDCDPTSYSNTQDQPNTQEPSDASTLVVAASRCVEAPPAVVAHASTAAQRL